VNNISSILFLFLLIVSNVSADTGFNKSTANSSPSDDEIRAAVVSALLAQENQSKKTAVKPLKKATTPAVFPNPAKKELDANTLLLMKAKQKDQDKQRIKLKKIVATANKKIKKQAKNKKRSLPSAIATNKKKASETSKLISITANKKGTMTPLVVAEENKPKTSNAKKEASPKIANNTQTNQPKLDVGTIEKMPIGRNQLATESIGGLDITGKNIIDILATKQEGISHLSNHTIANKPELQLNIADSTAEGRNDPAVNVKKTQGWIYLGRFDSGKWENQTLDVEKQLPQVGKQYVVKATSLYVRDAKPKKGKMGKIIHAFRTNDKIKILKLKGLGRNRDFYWAEVLRQ